MRWYFSLFLLLIFSPLLLLAQQNQLLHLTSFLDTPQWGGEAYPIEMFGEPAPEGCIIQINCAGNNGIIEPPIFWGPEMGLPSGDDFMADPVQNGISTACVNCLAAYGVPGSFMTEQPLICLPAFTGAEPVINIGDILYMRAFDSDHWSTAMFVWDVVLPFQVEFTTGEVPDTLFGIEFFEGGAS